MRNGRDFASIVGAPGRALDALALQPIGERAELGHEDHGPEARSIDLADEVQ